MTHNVSLLVAVFLSTMATAFAAVTGRYVRLDAVNCAAMEMAEVELYSGGTNLLLRHPELISGGLGDGLYGRIDRNTQAAPLTDGNPDPAQRGSVSVAERNTSWPFIEIDIGQSRLLDSFCFQTSRWDETAPRVAFNDATGWRVLTVLDDHRRVIFSRLVTLYTLEYKTAKGRLDVPLDSPGGPLQGREIPAGSRGWFTSAEFLIHYFGVTETTALGDADSQVRRREFKERNSPAALRKFAAEFWPALDLSRPGLVEVRHSLAAGRNQEAWAAFNRYFLTKLEYLDCVTPYTTAAYPATLNRSTPPPHTNDGLMMFAEDLLQKRRVDLGKKTVIRSPPGQSLDSIRPDWCTHLRPLLLAYAATGEKRYLDAWAEGIEEWALFYSRWADGGERREYFPLTDPIVSLGKDLREVARLLPALVADLPPAALARFLCVVMEEWPPAYWRLARKTVFNHQFNIWGGAYLTGQVFDDFHAGQRLQREVAQQFERLWTLALTRDGVMIEVGDTEHLPMPLFTAAHLYPVLKKDRPEWFDSGLESYFLHQYRDGARFMARYVAPAGTEHRSGNGGNYFGWLKSLFFPGPDGLGPTYPNVPNNYTGAPHDIERLFAPLMAEPEVRAIMDTVYGRGRKTENLSKAAQAECDALASALGGQYQGRPQTVSDYLPYVGFHYLRRGWEKDDSFIEMLCQPTPGTAAPWNVEHPGALSENWWGTDYWDTQFKYSDFTEPLLLARPLLVDGQSQCSDFETKLRWPGSKTGRLTEAAEKPMPNRFHCSPLYDYQECFFAGAYQNWALGNDTSSHIIRFDSSYKLKIAGPAITGVRTTRQLFQLRKNRLFIAVDRIRFSDEAEHQLSMRNVFLPNDPEAVILADSATGTLRLERKTGAQLTLRHFGAPDLRYEAPVRFEGYKLVGKVRRYVNLNWLAKEESVLVSLLEPRRDAATPPTLKAVQPLTAADAVGFTATTSDGETIIFQVPSRLPKAADGVTPAAEQAVLAVKAGTHWTGLAIGTETLNLDGCQVKLAGDAEFAISADRATPETTPILRPIDPPTILPGQAVFIDRLTISIASATPGVEIRYTVDNSEPSATSVFYQGPFEINESCWVQARAFRPGVNTLPFAAEGTRVSEVSFARFRKGTLKPAVGTADAAESNALRRAVSWIWPAKVVSKPGLAYDYLEGSWLRLFGSADRRPATSSGTTTQLMDVSMRQTAGPFAVRYHGYIDIPANGVYTFHAPPEYARCKTLEPGYDLRVFVDGEEWQLSQIWHGLGTWSVPLAKGPHRFMVVFADARAKDLEKQRIDYWWGYPAPWVVWRGTAPELRLSGPKLECQPIPATWLTH